MASLLQYDLETIQSSFGLMSFMNTAPGFSGTVKDRPEDFIVTEIDHSGVPVSVDNRAIPLRLDKQPVASESKRFKMMSVDSSNVKQSFICKPANTMADIEESQLDLRDAFSQEKISELLVMSMQYKERRIAAGLLSNLGVLNDKSKRSAVHRAVRVAHPLLKTVTVKAESGNTEIHVVADPTYAEIVALLPEDVCEEILVFASKYVSPEVNTLDLSVEEDKAKRTEIHRVIHKLFGSFIETKTLEVPNKGPFIQLRYRQKNSGKRRVQDRTEDESSSFFLQFCIRKENMETLDAISHLSRLLGCQPSQFSYAGVKDRRAITFQRMTVRNITADRLEALNTSGTFGMQFGSYSYVDQPLHLGDHKGNHFEITIGNPVPLDPNIPLLECVTEAFSAVERSGFVNYYGRQRFGLEGSSIHGWHIGLAMLRRKFMDAVKLMLKPDLPGTDDPVQNAKQYFTATADIEGTLQKMPHFKSRECMVLKALKRHGFTEFGCTQALHSLPYHMRMLYVHSFTSLLWNHLASYRISRHGCKPTEGDLVEVAMQGETEIAVVTASDIAEGKYSLSDVVLPLVGINSKLPANSVGDQVSQLLKEADLPKESFRIKALGLSVPGSYRKLLSYPLNLSWEEHFSRQSSSRSSSTCKDTVEIASSSHPKSGLSPSGGSGDQLSLTTEKDYVFSVCVKVTLCPSSYATVFLREVMKL